MSIFICCLCVVVWAQYIPKFPATSYFSQDISNAPVQSNSAQITQWLLNAGSWKFQIDLSFHLMMADCNTRRLKFVPTQDYSSDCEEQANLMVPVPPNGAIEGDAGDYSPCDGDCHYLAWDKDANVVWETYITSVDATSISAQCLITWDMNRVYPNNMRGEQCTSADAAGFSIASLLFSPDELKAGVIDHPIRFILQNPKMRSKFYVHPASHAGGPSSTDPNAPIYGSRWRLKASYDISALPASAQVIARALKKYGMFLADGGNIALTGVNDKYTTTKYADLPGFDTHMLLGLKPTDFDVIQYIDPPVPLTYDCVKNTTIVVNNAKPACGGGGVTATTPMTASTTKTTTKGTTTVQKTTTTTTSRTQQTTTASVAAVATTTTAAATTTAATTAAATTTTLAEPTPAISTTTNLLTTAATTTVERGCKNCPCRADGDAAGRCDVNLECKAAPAGLTDSCGNIDKPKIYPTPKVEECVTGRLLGCACTSDDKCKPDNLICSQSLNVCDIPMCNKGEINCGCGGPGGDECFGGGICASGRCYLRSPESYTQPPPVSIATNLFMSSSLMISCITIVHFY